MSKEDSRDCLIGNTSFQEDLRAALKRKVASSARREQSSSATANSQRRGQSSSLSPAGKSSGSLQTPQRKRKPEESYEDLIQSCNELTSSKRCEKFASKKKKNEMSSKDEEERFGVSFPYIVKTAFYHKYLRVRWFKVMCSCMRDRAIQVTHSWLIYTCMDA